MRVVPPIRFPTASSRKTPIVLPRAASPLASVPIKLPWTDGAGRGAGDVQTHGRVAREDVAGPRGGPADNGRGGVLDHDAIAAVAEGRLPGGVGADEVSLDDVPRRAGAALLVIDTPLPALPEMRFAPRRPSRRSCWRGSR